MEGVLLARAAAGGPIGAAAGGDVRLQAEDRLDVGGLGLAEELDGAVEVAVVGDRQGGHPQRLGPPDQGRDLAGAVEQAVVAVAVQVDERPAGHRGHLGRVGPASRPPRGRTAGRIDHPSVHNPTDGRTAALVLTRVSGDRARRLARIFRPLHPRGRLARRNRHPRPSPRERVPGGRVRGLASAGGDAPGDPLTRPSATLSPRERVRIPDPLPGRGCPEGG